MADYTANIAPFINETFYVTAEFRTISSVAEVILDLIFQQVEIQIYIQL